MKDSEWREKATQGFLACSRGYTAEQAREEIEKLDIAKFLKEDPAKVGGQLATLLKWP